MLDCQKQGLLALVRAALTGEGQPLPDGFSLEAAYDAIQKHNIAVMALEGALKCGLSRRDPAVAGLFRMAFRAIGAVEAQDKTAAALFAAFEAADIDFMPIKGAVLRGLYPKREYRSMSDMDVLVRMEQYERIREIMAGMGFEERYESDHELVWHRRELHLELHKLLIPSYNDDLYEYYGDGWKMARKTETSRHVMRDEDHFVYVFAHMAKHYRDGGVGIRQMCDVWLMRQRCPDMNEGYIRSELEKMELLEFYDNVRMTLDVWFGEGEMTEKAEHISHVIFESGAFGQAREHMLAHGARLTDGNKATRFTRYKRIWDRVFLNRKDMKIKYPLLKKAPALMPVMWVYRGIYIAVKEPQKIRRERRGFGLLVQENIDVYQQSLKYVGLKYKQR